MGPEQRSVPGAAQLTSLPPGDVAPQAIALQLRAALVPWRGAEVLPDPSTQSWVDFSLPNAQHSSPAEVYLPYNGAQ